MNNDATSTYPHGKNAFPLFVVRTPVWTLEQVPCGSPFIAMPGDRVCRDVDAGVKPRGDRTGLEACDKIYSGILAFTDAAHQPLVDGGGGG